MSSFTILLVLGSAFLHASWNLVAHSQRTSSDLFLRVSWVIGLLGVVPASIAEFQGQSFPLGVWGLLLLTGIFQAFYYLGLTISYRTGDFSVVYPLSRALPILLLAFVDIARGRIPSLLGWLGISLVVLGCLAAPLKSIQEVTKSHYWNRSTVWIGMTVVATLGYTTVDKLAAEILPSGAESAGRYGIWQAIFTIPFLLLTLKLLKEPISTSKNFRDWKLPIIAALFIFCSYWLMLWAYQISPYSSYLVGLRQFSIALGVVMSAWLFREPTPGLRIGAAIVITLGIVCLSLAR
jgi:drug/metabolite transporter (DMT)-like permease